MIPPIFSADDDVGRRGEYSDEEKCNRNHTTETYSTRLLLLSLLHHLCLTIAIDLHSGILLSLFLSHNLICHYSFLHIHHKTNSNIHLLSPYLLLLTLFLLLLTLILLLRDKDRIFNHIDQSSKIPCIIGRIKHLD
jgi:hypothetical protein